MGDYGRSLKSGVMVNADACGYEEASALVPRTERVRLFTVLPIRVIDVMMC